MASGCAPLARGTAPLQVHRTSVVSASRSVLSRNLHAATRVRKQLLILLGDVRGEPEAL